MNFGIIFLILALQILLALIVGFVLKAKLDRELLENALEQLEVIKYQGDLHQIKAISVVGHKAIDPKTQLRIKNIAARRFRDIPIDFSTENSFKGGVKISIGDLSIDCTLSDRLEKIFNPSR